MCCCVSMLHTEWQIDKHQLCCHLKVQQGRSSTELVQSKHVAIIARTLGYTAR